MIILAELDTNHQSAFSLAILLSGAVGAVVASVLTLAATFYLDGKNKTRALQAELRRHRVNRMITAADGLRSCFFTGLTMLEYHRIELAGIEPERERNRVEISKQRMNTVQTIVDNAIRTNEEKSQLRLQDAIIRYNAEVSKVEASAKSFVESLDDPILPPELFQRLRMTVGALTEGHTTAGPSIDIRIKFFNDWYPKIKTLLQELELTIEMEITKPMRKLRTKP
jgi:hypothetical protein